MSTLALVKSIRKKVPSDLLKFICVGIGAVLIDTFCYITLVGMVNMSLAKGVSFLLGSLFAYVLNNYWTFNVATVSTRNVFRFFVLYTTTLTLNIIVNGIINELFGMFFIAFLVATGVSTVTNFVGQKFWVFIR